METQSGTKHVSSNKQDELDSLGPEGLCAALRGGPVNNKDVRSPVLSTQTLGNDENVLEGFGIQKDSHWPHVVTSRDVLPVLQPSPL